LTVPKAKAEGRCCARRWRWRWQRGGEIEAWGRGIQRVMEACRETGVPEPRIRVEPREFWFEFPFSGTYLAQVGALETRTGTSGETTQKTTQETTQEKIVALLRENPQMTRRALAQQVGITPDGVKYHLGKLREAKRIRHVGPTKKGRWEVLDGGQP